MNSSRAIGIAVTSIAFFALIGWGSRATLPASDHGQAILRLSWRMRPDRAETCRDRTQAELDALPVHMRTPRVCERRMIPYRLIVRIDDGKPDTTVVLPAGARHDRPIYVLRDTLLAPGEHTVFVTFGTRDPAGHDDDEDDGDDDKDDDQTLRFERKLNFEAGRIELVTLGSDGKSFISRSAQ